jgi:hypothetical protein
MRWLELTVRTHPEAVESVSELLSRYTPGGVAIEEGSRYKSMLICPLMGRRKRRGRG